jgi:hypothetical protein
MGMTEIHSKKNVSGFQKQQPTAAKILGKHALTDEMHRFLSIRMLIAHGYNTCEYRSTNPLVFIPIFCTNTFKHYKFSFSTSVTKKHE